MTALTKIDLYATGVASYTGAKDTGLGIGLPQPSPLLATYKQYGTPPTGFDDGFPPKDCWISGGYLYLLEDSGSGLGAGIYRYLLDSSDPIGMSYDSHVPIASLLAGANKWSAHGAACYDSSDDSVVLAGYNTSGTGNTPVIGKWSCSTAWPWGAGNADWLSDVQQSYGSYQAGQITDQPMTLIGDSKVYVGSSHSGQIHTLLKSTGVSQGSNVWYAARSANYLVRPLGELAGFVVVGDRYLTNGISVYNATAPTSWSLDDVIYPESQYNDVWASSYKRGHRRMHGAYVHMRPIQRSELTWLGIPSTVCGYWMGHRHSTISAKMAIFHDSAGDNYSERLLAANSYHRGGGSGYSGTDLFRFVNHANTAWLVDWAIATQDQEEEDPGGNTKYHFGLMATPTGPATVVYTLSPISEAQPERFGIDLDASADNYLWSSDLRKYQVRYQVNSGGWSDWRSGPAQLADLSSVVDGKSAWAQWYAGDTVELEIKVGSGWPHDWGGTVICNAGEVTDPTTPQAASFELAPPREAVPSLWVNYDLAPAVSVTEITNLQVLAAYVSPQDLQGPWVSSAPYAVALTEAAFSANGNRPYVIGSDWSAAMALCFTDELTGLQKGQDLTSSSVTATIVDRLGSVVVLKTNSLGIELRPQLTTRANGGTRGEFVMSFTDAEAVAYEGGIYELRVLVTWPDSDISSEIRGQIEFVRE